MTCKKCGRSIPDDAIFCPYCGMRQQPAPKRKKTRANGAGTIIKTGSTYTAIATVYLGGVRRTKKKSGFPTKAAAAEVLPELRKLLLGIRLVEDDITLADLYARWVPFYTPRVSPGQMQSYAAAFKWMTPLHTRAFRSLTTENFQDILDTCPRGKRTKEDIKTLASLLYKYANDLQIINANYAKNLFCGRERTKPRKAFTPEQVEQIAASVGVLPWADYVLCMIYTGFRPGEMLALTKDRYTISKTGEPCLIGGYKTEAGTDRVIPIHARILPIIQQRMDKEGVYIFPRENGAKMSDEYFRKCCFAPLMEKLGIEGCVPYSCRHTFANMLKNVPGSDTDKAALMGHADASMTKYYQESDLASRLEIMGKI